MTRFDPFGDFTTRGYLRNVFGISAAQELAAVERTLVQMNMPLALKALSAKRLISYEDIKAVHAQLFGSLYPWAGQDRLTTSPTIEISKSGIPGMFARPEHIRLAAEHGLKLASDAQTMRTKPGTIMGYLAHSHPFLDGNGRTIMAVHQELCRRAGFHIDWSRTDKKNYLKILTEELLHPEKGFLDSYLVPKIVNRTLALEPTARLILSIPGLTRDVVGPEVDVEGPNPVSSHEQDSDSAPKPGF